MADHYKGRISVLDLYNSPPNVVHDLLRIAINKANADAKAEEQRKLEEERSAKKKGRQPSPPINSAGFDEDDLEELFEEGF